MDKCSGFLWIFEYLRSLFIVLCSAGRRKWIKRKSKLDSPQTPLKKKQTTSYSVWKDVRKPGSKFDVLIWGFWISPWQVLKNRCVCLCSVHIVACMCAFYVGKQVFRCAVLPLLSVFLQPAESTSLVKTQYRLFIHTRGNVHLCFETFRKGGWTK